MLLASLTATASPQLFALAREYADSRNKQADMFSSVLRAQFSLAWVIGPPIAFALAIGYGFEVMYLASALAYVICAFVVWRWHPPAAAGDGQRGGAGEQLAGSVGAGALHRLHPDVDLQQHVPHQHALYITRELGLEESWPVC